MTYRELLQLGRRLLEPDSDAEIDARLLLEEASGLSVSAYLLHEHDEASSEEEARFLSLIRRRGTREPIAYILGNQEFMGLRFQTTPAVLIPRQDTETLVELALNHAKERCRTEKRGSFRILDLCCGSGCIGISLAYYLSRSFPNVRIEAILTDLSEEALAVAKNNADELLAGSGVFWKLCLGDLWNAIDENAFDMIVSNPPYINDADMKELPGDVALYEPAMALAGGTDGLDFYRLLFEKLDAYLAADGSAYFEIGDEQGEALRIMADRMLPHYRFGLYQDLGGHDRVIELCRKET